MGFTVETGVSVFTVFLQGLLSFFSPCVLPLLPVYLSYLSGGARTVEENGTIRYQQKKVLLNTLFFLLGVSFTFFLLGFGFRAAGIFLGDNKVWFTRAGGILIVLFGLYQLGIFGSSRTLSTERRLPFRLDKMAMNPLTALLLGFTFSFAWTPCVGPTLTSVLLMATSGAAAEGFLLIGVYTLGFVLPFLAVGFFTGKLLALFRKHQNVVKYTVKIGGVLMILVGIMMFTGWMNGFSSYLSQVGLPASESAASETSSASEASSQTTSSDQTDLPAAIDFTLTDQNGVTHSLSDYKGKTVFLNFWGTWCPPCRAEMPDIQKLYQELGENKEDVIVLGVAFPNAGQEGSAEEISSFLTDNAYTYPCLMDDTGVTASAYQISSFPTTFMIDKDGNVFGYVRGQITYEMMESIVRQTMEGKREQ